VKTIDIPGAGKQREPGPLGIEEARRIIRIHDGPYTLNGMYDLPRTDEVVSIPNQTERIDAASSIISLSVILQTVRGWIDLGPLATSNESLSRIERKTRRKISALMLDLWEKRTALQKANGPDGRFVSTLKAFGIPVGRTEEQRDGAKDSIMLLEREIGYGHVRMEGQLFCDILRPGMSEIDDQEGANIIAYTRQYRDKMMRQMEELAAKYALRAV
jgi:hypothetical protein